MSTNMQTRADERHNATTEGRIVLALEMIADELRTIGDSLTRMCGKDGPGNADARRSETQADRRAGDRWENEGGHVRPEPPADRDVKRTLVEHFAVGGYNYTNLKHAIAEAKRARMARAQ